MRRTAILVVTLVAMLWQSMALARMAAAEGALADLAHASLHWLEQGHHHHDDGGYHEDDSAESARHLIADQVNTSPAPPPGRALGVTLGTAPSPIAQVDDLTAQPYLDGLLRPPRPCA
jgi:hypothetical protein